MSATDNRMGDDMTTKRAPRRGEVWTNEDGTSFLCIDDVPDDDGDYGWQFCGWDGESTYKIYCPTEGMTRDRDQRHHRRVGVGVAVIPGDLPCPCHGSDKLCPDCAGSGVVTAAAILDAGVRYFADRARHNDTLAAMWGEW